MFLNKSYIFLCYLKTKNPRNSSFCSCPVVVSEKRQKNLSLFGRVELPQPFSSGTGKDYTKRPAHQDPWLLRSASVPKNSSGPAFGEGKQNSDSFTKIMHTAMGRTPHETAWQVWIGWITMLQLSHFRGDRESYLDLKEGFAPRKLLLQPLLHPFWRPEMAKWKLKEFIGFFNQPRNSVPKSKAPTAARRADAASVSLRLAGGSVASTSLPCPSGSGPVPVSSACSLL